LLKRSSVAITKGSPFEKGLFHKQELQCAHHPTNPSTPRARRKLSLADLIRDLATKYSSFRVRDWFFTFFNWQRQSKTPNFSYFQLNLKRIELGLALGLLTKKSSLAIFQRQSRLRLVERQHRENLLPDQR
jgi:hypothetical protein